MPMITNGMNSMPSAWGGARIFPADIKAGERSKKRGGKQGDGCCAAHQKGDAAEQGAEHTHRPDAEHPPRHRVDVVLHFLRELAYIGSIPRRRHDEVETAIAVPQDAEDAHRPEMPASLHGFRRRLICHFVSLPREPAPYSDLGRPPTALASGAISTG